MSLRISDATGTGGTPQKRPDDPLPEAEADRVVQRLRALRDRIRVMRGELRDAQEIATGLPLAYGLGPWAAIYDAEYDLELLEESLQVLEAERHVELVARERDS